MSYSHPFDTALFEETCGHHRAMARRCRKRADLYKRWYDMLMNESRTEQETEWRNWLCVCANKTGTHKVYMLCMARYHDDMVNFWVGVRAGDTPDKPSPPSRLVYGL